MRKTCRGILIMCMAMAALAMGSVSALATWSITDLGNLGGSPAIATATTINNLGQVAGTSTDAAGNSQGFFWSVGNGMQALPTLGGTKISGVASINNLGQITGSSYVTGDANSNAFLWSSANGITSLGTLSGLSTDTSSGKGVNDSGHVAGSSYYTGGGTKYHAYFYKDGSKLDLGTLPGITNMSTYSVSYASGLNNADQVVGYSYYNGGTTKTHAYIWDLTNGMQDLGTLPGIVSGSTYSVSRANGINNAGQIVGYSYYSGGASKTQAVVWNNGVIQGLGFLSGGTISTANAINNTGQIVGQSNAIISGATVIHACLWSDSRVIDLADAATAAGSALVPGSAYGINDLGQIACGAADSSGSSHAIVLTQNLKVTSFTMPAATTGNLTVPVTKFEATDSVGVTGYLITESATAPDYNDPGWSTTSPTQFIYTAVGNAAYAWVKDAAGNVSFGVKAKAPDTTAPTVTFAMPATATTLTVPITTFMATDDTGVTGYMLTESAIAPAATDSGWSATAADSFTFSSFGAKIVYAWAKDAAGNVSTGVSANLVISKPAATVAFGNLTFTYDGTAKSATATTTPAGLTVDFTYNGSATAPTNAGTYTVAATINDTTYQGSATGTLTINKVTSTVSWSKPADIDFGTALSATQLNATASVPGTFSYTPAAGMVLDPGSQTLTVAFTPADATNYTTADGTVTLTVLPIGNMSGGATTAIGDALLALQSVVGLHTPTVQEIRRGDVSPLVNGKPAPDGTIDVGDALVILKRVVALITW